MMTDIVKEHKVLFFKDKSLSKFHLKQKYLGQLVEGKSRLTSFEINVFVFYIKNHGN